MMKIKT